MKVSELAKELGYKAAELIELAKTAKIAIENIRAEVDGRKAAQIRAHVPHRRNLKGALLDAFTKVQADILAIEAAKPAESKPARKKKEPAAEGAEADGKAKKAKPAKKGDGAVEAPAAPAAAEASPAAAAKAEKDKKPKEVVLLSSRDVATAAEKPKPHHLPKVGLTAEEKAAIKAEVEKPLIDVDKVIGQEHEVRVQRAAEATALDKEKIAPQEDKLHRHLTPRTNKPAPAPVRPVMRPPPPPPPMRPRVPPPVMRPAPLPPKPKVVPVPMSERKIEVTAPISIKDFSAAAGIKASDIIRKLMQQGAMVTINASLNADQVASLSVEFNRDVTVKKTEAMEDAAVRVAADLKDDPKDVVVRAPVVTFMGHVDHGKTSLLDKIRDANVAAGESGGITQHIGAWKVVAKDGKPVVFLDTPGHEAFTAMRARGATVTDVAVIVVAADDGVMPQTEEAINHAKAAGVKIVVALNKVDKPQANVNKVKGQLASIGLQPEDWGGSTVCVEVSALTGHNVDHLLEMLALEAELLELKANPKRPASGVILEAEKTEDRGVVAKILVQNGTLRRGDILLAGRSYGRVRSMHDDHGRNVPEAGPSTPVEVAGLVEVPQAGDKFMVLDTIDKARSIAEERLSKERDTALLERQAVTLENLFSHIESGKLKDVRVVLKVDVQGSAEVLKQSLQNLSTDEVKLKMLHCSVGTINESDVVLAAASQAIIIGFHVEPDDGARQLAKDKGVDIRLYSVIYQAIEEMKAALEGLLEPEQVEVKTGHLTIKEIFRISRVGAIAGCICTDGKIERSGQVRLIRNGQVVFTGKVEGLRRFKDDVKEVVEGYECGVKLAGHDDLRPGDIVEAYQIQKVARKLAKK